MSIERARLELDEAKASNDPRIAAVHIGLFESALREVGPDAEHEANALRCECVNFVIGDWLDAVILVAPSFTDDERRECHATATARIDDSFDWLDAQAERGRIPDYDPVKARAGYACLLTCIKLATAAPLA